MKFVAIRFAPSFALARHGRKTLRGAGEDIRKAGSAVENAAKKI